MSPQKAIRVNVRGSSSVGSWISSLVVRHLGQQKVTAVLVPRDRGQGEVAQICEGRTYLPDLQANVSCGA